MSFLARSLTTKLTLAFLGVALATAALVYALVNNTTRAEYYDLLVEAERDAVHAQMVEHYARVGSWEGLDVITGLRAPDSGPPGHGAGGPGAPPPNQPGQRPPPPPDGPPPGGDEAVTNLAQRGRFIVVDAAGIIVLPISPYELGQPAPAALVAMGEPLMLEGEQIGTVFDANPLPLMQLSAEEAYLTRLNTILLRATGVAMLMALLLSVALARLMLRPIRDLTGAAQALAAGKLDQQVPVRSQDELGTLARAFNQMSTDLAHATQMRRQMTADIAHDLRTPLQVIAGYVEAMRDHVLKPTTDRLDTIYSEIELLQRLISDLFMLAKADAGELPLQRQSVQPQELLARVERSFTNQAARQKVRLRVEAPDNLPALHADEERLTQVLSNLVSNALHHTPEGGEVHLSARRVGDHVALAVSDTGQGIPADALPHLFERFYRVDKSRKGAGTGLGLAIARSLVEAHGGTIRAASDGLGHGATFTLSLPTAA